MTRTPSTEVKHGQVVQLPKPENGDLPRVHIRQSRKGLSVTLAGLIALGAAVIGWIERREGKLEERVKADVTVKLNALERKTELAIAASERAQAKAINSLAKEERARDDAHQAEQRQSLERIWREVSRTRRAMEGP